MSLPPCNVPSVPISIRKTAWEPDVGIVPYNFCNLNTPYAGVILACTAYTEQCHILRQVAGLDTDRWAEYSTRFLVGARSGATRRLASSLADCRSDSSQPVIFRRLGPDSEFGSPALLCTKPRRDVSIAARLVLIDASIGGSSSSLPTCCAIVANDRD